MSDRIAGTLLFAFAVWFGYEATHFKIDFMADPIGPKAFPLILAVAMALISPFLIARPDEEPHWPGARILITLAVVFVSFIFYAYLLGRWGPAGDFGGSGHHGRPVRWIGYQEPDNGGGLKPGPVWPVRAPVGHSAANGDDVGGMTWVF